MIGSPGRARVPAFLAPFDPERIAAALSAVVLAVVGLGLVATGSRVQPAAVPTTLPLVRPSQVPASTGPSAPASGVPSLPVPAGLRTLIDTNVDILRARADLVAEMDATNPDAGTIARTLRMLNPLLAAAEAQTRSIAWGESASPAQDLIGIYEAAHDASTATLRASLSSTGSYVTGAGEVARLLGPIPGITRDLARRAGVPVPPEASTEASAAP